jgi:hypothetical protein
VRCQNFGDKETLAHLSMCPGKDRVNIFTEGADELIKCMEKQDKTNPEISYQLPMFIKL